MDDKLKMLVDFIISADESRIIDTVTRNELMNYINDYLEEKD